MEIQSPSKEIELLPERDRTFIPRELCEHAGQLLTFFYKFDFFGNCISLNDMLFYQRNLIDLLIM